MEPLIDGLHRAIPKEQAPDSTVQLLLDPYRFIGRRCRHHRADLFETRVLLEKTICMTGRDAARLVYDPARFQREGAAPARLQKTLFGRGGIQGLDGARHRRRKRLFLSLLGGHDRLRAEAVADKVGDWLQIYAQRWAAQDQVVLMQELPRVLCRAVCDWAGVPLPASEVEKRSWELSRLFLNANTVGPAYWRTRAARHSANQWAAQVIAGLRTDPQTDSASVAAQVAQFRDVDNELLSEHEAGVDLLNILRPTVAISVFIVQAAAALHRYPESREQLLQDVAYEMNFVQEVRRYYPFFPAVGGRVREPFEWLDLYGTNHDPRYWEDPEAFRPARFNTLSSEDPFVPIPQGGGYHATNHRCAGEWVTEAVIRRALRFLTAEIDYTVPEQDFDLNYRAIPPVPGDGFRIASVRLRH